MEIVCSGIRSPALRKRDRRRSAELQFGGPRLRGSRPTSAAASPAHSVSSRASARDLLFARTATAAQVHHHFRPQRVIPSVSEGPAFRPHCHRCSSSPPPPPAACHPERQRGTCFSPAPPPLLKFTTNTARSVSSRASARDLLFARTGTAAQVHHHHRPQRVIPSVSEGPAFRPHRHRCSSSPPPTPPAACHPERQRGTCFSPALPPLLKFTTTTARSVSSRASARDLLFARTATAAQVHHHYRPRRVIPSVSEGPAFRPHRHRCSSSPPPPPAACHPERQRGTCFSPARHRRSSSPPLPPAACHPERQRGTCFSPAPPPRLKFTTTTARSVSSRASARDLLFARTATAAQVHHHLRPQRVIPSVSEGPAFRPHCHRCSSSPPLPPAACHPERQRGTCFSPAPPPPLKFTTTSARSVSSRASARDLLFARTATAAQVHHHYRPQRVIPSVSEGPAFRPHRHRCSSSPPPPPAACHPERQRGTCFSPAPPPLLKFTTTTARSVSSRASARDLLFARSATAAQFTTTTARSVSSRASARDLLFARTATAADVIRDVKCRFSAFSS